MSNAKPRFPHIVPIVTMRCNLKCKLCILDVPYYVKPFHPGLEHLKEVTDRVFEMGNYDIFEFNGGEPLLRTDLPELWEHALQYIDCAGIFKTVTNGTIMPSDDLIAVWQKYGQKFHLIVDNYGTKLSPRAKSVYDKVKSSNISCELRDMYTCDKHHGGWIDFRAGDVLHNETDAEKIYLSCGQLVHLKHCCNIINGLLMPCHMQFKLHDRNIDKPSAQEYIDIFDDTESMETKREKMRGFTDTSKLKFLSACRYCFGLNDTAERFTPAVQLSDEELLQEVKIPKSKRQVI